MPIDPDYLKASNGSGEAVQAILVTDRSVGNSEFNVDSVLNWPAKFIATVGTLDASTGTLDPNTITVFFGSLSGSYIEIDSFAPGYSDTGNTQDQIIVLKPTTAWSDGIAETIQASGSGDMSAAVYDPTNVASDAFDQDNMADGTTNKNYTATEQSKLAGIEDLADVTDTTNVTAAGALMDSELASIADVKALDQSVISGASPVFATTNMTEGTDKNFVTDAEATIIGNTSGTNTGDQDISGIATNASAIALRQLILAEGAFVDGDKTKLDGIEDGADITDTTNVTSAGALMDSEVTNLAQVKAFSSADYATAAQGALADSATQPGDLATVATTGAYSDLSGTPTIPTSVDQLNPSQTSNAGKFLKTDGTNATWESIPGGGDMLIATYDPAGVSEQLVGLTATQTLTNKTINANNNTITNLAHGAEVDDPSSGVHGVSGSVVGTSDTQTLTNKTLTAPVLNTSISGTAFLDEDNMASDSATKVASQQSIKAYVDAAITAAKSALYPVGSYYINETDSTNPATLLGFGTWSAVTDVFLVGHGSTYTTTGGSATATLVANNIPSLTLNGITTYKNGSSDTANRISGNNTGGSGVSTNGSVTPSYTNGSPTAVDTIPPYQATYIWIRTA
ncbi:mucin-19-like [Sycon ciliatum]|uniref:mucin-19-like n=1 Tax=Sycon ciliatum TaxID=27933 RepID=UPI0031F6AE07